MQHIFLYKLLSGTSVQFLASKSLLFSGRKHDRSKRYILILVTLILNVVGGRRGWGQLRPRGGGRVVGVGLGSEEGGRSLAQIQSGHSAVAVRVLCRFDICHGSLASEILLEGEAVGVAGLVGVAGVASRAPGQSAVHTTRARGKRTGAGVDGAVIPGDQVGGAGHPHHAGAQLSLSIVSVVLRCEVGV